MIRPMHLVVAGAMVALTASPSSAQEHGFLAIDPESALHAFSLTGAADAVNMCGTTACEVVATFSTCLGVAHSSTTTRGQPVWTWSEAATDEIARAGALDECTDAGGGACAVVNVICLDAPAIEAALGLDGSTRKLIQQQLEASGFGPGAADGLFGPNTRSAIRRWQESRGEPPTGYLNTAALQLLQNIGVSAASSAEEVPLPQPGESARISDLDAERRALLQRVARQLHRERTTATSVDSDEQRQADNRLARTSGSEDVAATDTDEPAPRLASRNGEGATERAPGLRAQAPVPPGHCTKQRLMRLGRLTSSIDSGTTLEFTSSRMVMVRSAGRGASLRQESEYSVTADATTYRVVRAVGTAPGLGTRDVPISNPGPHTLPCSISGAVLAFGDGTWR